MTLPADLAEEIARVYGYDRFPSTLLRDELPPQRDNPRLEGADRVRDILTGCGLDEIIAYSMTTEAREALLGVKDERPYLHVVNPIASDKTAMRHTLLASALDTVASNLRFAERVAVFEIGSVYLPREGQPLPDEPRHLSIAMTGPRQDENWQPAERKPLDFWDIKGVVEVLIERLHVQDAHYEPADHPSYHPGRSASLVVNGKPVGVFGELHPLVRKAFDLPDQPVCVAEFDLEVLLEAALAARVSIRVALSRRARGHCRRRGRGRARRAGRSGHLERRGTQGVLREVRLFDLYRGEQIGAGRKSLAYRLVYQAADRTLTDEDATKLRTKIVKTLERELSATLRAQ